MKHLTLLPLTLLMAVVLLLTVSVHSTAAGHPDLTGPLFSDSQPKANLPISLSPFGVQLLTQPTDSNYISVLTQAKTLGVQWVRVDLAWYRIQSVAPETPGCGNCDWSYPDLLFSTLAAQGFTPIVTLWGSPSWVTPYPNGPIGSDHLGDLGNFVSALAQRYPNVQYWEFYNEPDDWGPVSGWGGAGQQYAAMLTTAYNAIHPNGAAGAGALPQYVVFGGVASEPDVCASQPNGTCFDTKFLTTVQGGKPLFDIMAFHFYASYANKYSPPNVIGKALKLKQSFPALIGTKPFLVTELGKGYESGTDKTYNHENAARLVVQMFAALMAGVDSRYGVNMVAGTWFTLEHNETLAGKQIRKWGLLDEVGNPWPLEGAAYTTAVKELSNATYLGPIAALWVTGYKFRAADGSIHAVVWATNPPGTALPKLPIKISAGTSSLRWLNKAGLATRVFDNSKADPDRRIGWIRITVPQSPIFVEYR